jgi:hypothetical protein
VPSVRIDGIAHGLAVNCHAFVGLPVIGVPALERSVEGVGIHPDEQIANDAFAGNETLPVLDPAAEAFAGLGTQIFGPPGNCLVTHRGNPPIPTTARGSAIHSVPGI